MPRPKLEPGAMCGKGRHRLTEADIYIPPRKGGRQCLLCQRERDRERRKAQNPRGPYRKRGPGSHTRAEACSYDENLRCVRCGERWEIDAPRSPRCPGFQKSEGRAS